MHVINTIRWKKTSFGYKLQMVRDKTEEQLRDRSEDRLPDNWWEDIMVVDESGEKITNVPVVTKVISF